MPMLRSDIDKAGPIEFRQPPGSLTKDDTRFCCQFAFVFGSIRNEGLTHKGWPVDTNREASMDMLREVLRKAKVPYMDYDDQLLESRFRDKKLLPNRPRTEITYTPGDVARMNAKEGVEDLKMRIAEAAVAGTLKHF